MLQYHTLNSSEEEPTDSKYEDANILAKKREKIIVSENRIKVVLSVD